MPEAWSERDERMYEHIKRQKRAEGVEEDRAKEIAARTVNKQRRQEGKTPNESTQGTGNPNARLEDRTRDELYQRAKELDVDGRSEMTKGELVDAIRAANG